MQFYWWLNIIFVTENQQIDFRLNWIFRNPKSVILIQNLEHSVSNSEKIFNIFFTPKLNYVKIWFHRFIFFFFEQKNCEKISSFFFYFWIRLGRIPLKLFIVDLNVLSTVQLPTRQSFVAFPTSINLTLSNWFLTRKENAFVYLKTPKFYSSDFLWLEV